MQTNQLSSDTLRRLAELRPDGKVISLYLNLDPSEFASGQARATEINSLLDEAERKARDGRARGGRRCARTRNACAGRSRDSTSRAPTDSRSSSPDQRTCWRRSS